MRIPKKRLIPYFVVVLLTGCGGPQPIPDGRLRQPKGGFSYEVPEGWGQRKLAGVEFRVAEGNPAGGMTPNLFVDGVESGTTSEVAATVLRRYPAPSTVELERRDFQTDAGHTGIRITTARTASDGLDLLHFHYLLNGRDRVIAITGTCAKTSRDRFEPLFDTAMRSLETEK